MAAAMGQTCHTSYTLRVALMALVGKRPGLNVQVLWLLMTICRDKGRLLQAFERFPKAMKANPAIVAGIEFIKTFCVAYVSDERLTVNIATTHIPNTNPSACLYWHKLLKESVSGVDLVSTQYATQIALDAACMTINRAAMIELLAGIKKNRSRATRRLALRLNEEFYATAASDNFPLVWADQEDMLSPVWTAENVIMYSMVHMEAYALIRRNARGELTDEDPIVKVAGGFRFKGEDDLGNFVKKMKEEGKPAEERAQPHARPERVGGTQAGDEGGGPLERLRRLTNELSS